MTPDVSRAEWLEAHRLLREDLHGITHRLDLMNGRLRRVELSTAVQWVLWIIVGASAVALLPLLASHVH